jgi:trehalose 6-phosphate phosphatase
MPPPMQPFFSADGEAALAALAPLAPLLAFDFDGTLAPIVDDPAAARVPPELSLGLARLARRLPVAVISGRAVADVQARLDFEPRWVIGNHGIEDPSLPGRDAARDALDAARESLRAGGAALARAGVAVEDKGYSIALHYRRAPDAVAAVAAIDGLLEPLGERVARFGGKAVVNLHAPGAPDKAHALAALRLRAGASAVFFAGDDVNDEPAFASVAPPSLTVRVGPPGPASRAMYRVDDHRALLALLESLERLLSA